VGSRGNAPVGSGAKPLHFAPAWTPGPPRVKRAPPSTGEFPPVPIRFPTRRAALAGVFALGFAARPANAHAILESSEPAAGGSVASGPVTLTLRFNSRIDRARSRLTLTGPGQVKTTLRIGAGGPPEVLTATATLTPGAYVVRWQVLAIDGHITRGDVPFTVTGN